MADETTPGGPPAGLDAEGLALWQRAEKAKLAQAIATAEQATASARASALTSAVPDVADAPTGTVTLGASAGAFGPWLTHRTLQDAAIALGAAVGLALPAPDAVRPVRVLVVDDPAFLAGDWTAHRVDRSLRRLVRTLSPLVEMLDTADRELAAALRALARTEKAEARRPSAATQRRLDAVTETLAPTADAAAEPAPAGEGDGARAEAGPAAAALGAAVDLLALLRTDYALAATTTATPASELALLTTAQLTTRQPTIAVELDGFTTVPAASSVLTALEEAQGHRDAAARALARVTARLAPLDADLATLRARLARVEGAWATATTAKDVTTDELAALRAETDRLAARITAREQAGGPATAACAAVTAALADADALVADLSATPEGGRSPLLVAVSRERLRAGSRVEGSRGDGAVQPVTHVLVVRVDAAGGDVVTRRSILGTSGRVGFLGAVQTSWLLLDVATGEAVAGGAEAPARSMQYDLASGAASIQRVVDSGALDDDPLTRLEGWAKGLVVVVGLFLLAVGALGMVNLATG